MQFRYSAIFLMILLISCTTAEKKIAVNGFDSACLIFAQAAEKKALNPERFNPEQLGTYIAEELEKLPHQPALHEVKETYHAVFNAAPAVRYELFKQSAEYTLKRSWDCAAVKNLYQGN